MTDPAFRYSTGSAEPGWDPEASPSVTVKSDGSCADHMLGKMSGDTMVMATTDDTDTPVFVVIGGGGTKSVSYAIAGQIRAVFDGAVTAGHYVGASPTDAGKLTDLGAVVPGGTWPIGQVLETHGGAGIYAVQLCQGFDPPLLNPGNKGVTIDKGQLTLALTTQQVDAFTLAPGEVIDRFFMQVPQTFHGGGLSAMQITLLAPDGQAIKTLDVFNAGAAGVLPSWGSALGLLGNYGTNMGDLRTTRTIKVQFDSTGDNVNAATTGSLTISAEVLVLE
jgi:hypothetical protein